MLRDGAATGPFNAMKISGRAPAAWLDPDSTSRASSEPSVRSRLPESDSAASLASAVTLLSRICPALTAIVPSARLTESWPLSNALLTTSEMRPASIGRP